MPKHCYCPTSTHDQGRSVGGVVSHRTKGTSYSLPETTQVNHIAIKVIGDGGTSAIADLPTERIDEAADQPIYDLRGRRLSHVPSHGIYIKNGKKYVR